MNKAQAASAARALDKIINKYSHDHGSTIPVQQDPEGNSLSHLRWMIKRICRQEMPVDKTMRWLGFIQGGLVFWGIATLQEMKIISMRAVGARRKG